MRSCLLPAMRTADLSMKLALRPFYATLKVTKYQTCHLTMLLSSASADLAEVQPGRVIRHGVSRRRRAGQAEPVRPAIRRNPQRQQNPGGQGQGRAEGIRHQPAGLSRWHSGHPPQFVIDSCHQLFGVGFCGAMPARSAGALGNVRQAWPLARKAGCSRSASPAGRSPTYPAGPRRCHRRQHLPAGRTRGQRPRASRSVQRGLRRDTDRR